MGISLNYPDKILAGLNQSYTLTTDEGPPRGSVLLDGQEIPFRLILLGPPKSAQESTTPILKYKVSFILPEGSAGKTLILRFAAGSKSIEETKAVTDS